MRKSYVTVLIAFSLLLLCCESQKECEKLNSGSMMIHNDGSFMPDTICDFYKGVVKIASLAKGQMKTINDLPGGEFTLTVKLGSDTLYQDLDTIIACETSHYSTERYLPVSDQRLKKNIQPLNNVLKDLQQLNIYTFEYNRTIKGIYLPEGMHYGFMAQELKDVYPQFAVMNKNGYYAVNYQEMIPILVQGMKEQQKEIDELKREIQIIKSTLQHQAVAMK